MAELKADVLVLGAGMVGVSAALHLQKRGRNVVLIDRHELAGEETSYGNGGLIECASVFPYMFPRDLRSDPAIRDPSRAAGALPFPDLPTFLPWLVRYFLASSPERALHSAMAELPLIQRSLVEHEALIAEADVPELLRRTGWIKLLAGQRRARPFVEVDTGRRFVLNAGVVAAGSVVVGLLGWEVGGRLRAVDRARSALRIPGATNARRPCRGPGRGNGIDPGRRPPSSTTSTPRRARR